MEKNFTKYEKARMLGSRSLQIAMGAPFLVKLSKKDLEEMHYDSLEIAKKEFKLGVIPITIKRPMPETDTLDDEKAEA
ncbi:DNA-directed RNA polymerase subunit K [Thermoproteota archaeon]